MGKPIVNAALTCKYCERPRNGRSIMCSGHRERYYRKGLRGEALLKPFLVRTDSLSTPENLKERVYQILLRSGKRKWTLEELSTKLDAGVGRIRGALDELKAEGKNVNVDDTQIEILREVAPSQEPSVIDVQKFKGQKYVFGLTADNHLCSKYSRLEVLNALFDIWADQGVSKVYQCGNMIDGECRFNKFDLITGAGFENQVDYFVQNWPSRKGITTEFVTGDDHEGWYTQQLGIDVGAVLEARCEKAGRNDVKYLGHMEHDVELKAARGSSFMRLIHAGGGSAYAISYVAQKIVESYQGGEKPSILLVGHFHKAEYSYPREVHVVQAATTMDQSPFMRKKRLQAMVGGWTISFEVDAQGIVHAFTPQFHPFYDRAFYGGDRWKYHWK